MTKNATWFAKLPKCRLQQFIEAIHRSLDAPLTANLSESACTVVLWELTGVKPNTRTCNLRAKTYKGLIKRLIVAAGRMCSKRGEQRYMAIISKIADDICVGEDVLLQSAVSRGFCFAWLQEAFEKKSVGKKDDKGKAQAQATLTQSWNLEVRMPPAAPAPGADSHVHVPSHLFFVVVRFLLFERVRAAFTHLYEVERNNRKR